MTNRNIQYKRVSPKIEKLVKNQRKGTTDILNLLLKVQDEFGAITREMLEDVARLLDRPASQVYGIASFYSMLEVADQVPNEKSPKIRICDGPVCWLRGGSLNGSRSVLINNYPYGRFEKSSCLGLCDRAPAALIEKEQSGPIGVMEDTTRNYKTIKNSIHYKIPRAGEERLLLEHSDAIDPDSIESALEKGAYQGLLAAVNCNSEMVVDEVEKANLYGRGGAGFPTGRKWRFVAEQSSSTKYVICNADESEPLCFKDRILIDTNPHQILEGMAIAAYAVGADHGYIYIRGEYADQKRRLERAINQAVELGWLGKNIAKTKFSFSIEVHQGAGAYICGEETALIESLEGKRGEPRKRPPYPPVCGYQNQPTLVNNVETFAAVPHILRNGADWFKNISSNQAGGTKLYTLLGHINNPGLFEAKIGLTLRQIINDYGSGMLHGSNFKFALCGGAAGTIVGENMLDQPIDYGSAQKGISLGAGAFLVCDNNVSTVAMLRELMKFFLYESCGKCTPCRAGTQRAHALLNRLAEGDGQPGDIEELMHLADLMEATSFCGLGQSVKMPVASALRNFPGEFMAGIRR